MKTLKFYYLSMMLCIMLLTLVFLVSTGCQMDPVTQDGTHELSDVTETEAGAISPVPLKLYRDSTYVYAEWAGYTGRDTIRLLNTSGPERTNFTPDKIISTGRPAKVAYNITRVMNIPKVGTHPTKLEIEIKYRYQKISESHIYLYNPNATGIYIFPKPQPTATPKPQEVDLELDSSNRVIIKWKGFNNTVGFSLQNAQYGVYNGFDPTPLGYRDGWYRAIIPFDQLPARNPTSLASVKVYIWNNPNIWASDSIRKY